MILLVMVVHHASIHYLTVDLHPAAGKRNILKIHESGTDSGYRCGIVAACEITGRETVVDNPRMRLFHAGSKIHSTKFHLSIKPVKHQRSLTPPDIRPC